MKRNVLCLILAAAATAVSPLAAKTPIALHSLSVTLPKGDDALPDGPGVATVRKNCLGCHSPDMILNQPAMAKPAWQAEVAKMRNVYKAPVAEQDVAAIVDYLTAVKGSY